MPDPPCQFYVDKENVLLIDKLFAHRRDTYAVQQEDGSYIRLEEPLTVDVLRRHLAGDITVGTYQINPVDNTVKWICFDVDPEHVKDPQQVTVALYNESCRRFSRRTVLLEASRWPDPSFHIWVFFEPEFPAKAARWLGHKILEYTGVIVELFPKQAEVNPGDFGNLMKLPGGFHRETKKWSTFLMGDLTPIGTKVLNETEGCTFSERDIERILKLADKETSSVQIKLGVARYAAGKGTRKVRPCFREALKDHTLSHDMRLALAIEYLVSGYDVDKVTALFQSQEDFDERKTRYQVEHALNQGYQPRRCSTIQALGFCVGEACPVFRRRRRRFERTGVF